MRIALIDPVGGHGGMDYYDYGLAYGLGEVDCEVYYYTSNETPEKKFKNVSTFYPFSDVWKRNKLLKGFNFIGGYIKSFSRAKKNNLAIIHLHFFNLGYINSIILLIAKKIFNLNTVVTIHDVDTFKNSKSEKSIKNIFFLIDQIIVHNNFSMQELINKGVAEEKINVIPHGNYALFVSQLPYTIDSRLNGSLELLFFGQIKEVKGLDILLKAIAKVIKKTDKVHLTIAGRPWHDDTSVYDAIIEENNLQKYVTTNYSFIPDGEVAEYFSGADLVILPYKRIYQSGVLLLAMSYGRPVLASNLPAFSEIIEDGKTGLLFESENPEDLADRIMQVLNNKEGLNSIRDKANVELETNYNWKEIGGKTLNVYEKIIS